MSELPPFAAAFDALTEYILIADEATGRVNFANRACLDATGWDPAAVLGRPVGEMLDGSPPPGEPWRNASLRDAAGGAIPVEVRASCADLPHGPGIMFVCRPDARKSHAEWNGPFDAAILEGTSTAIFTFDREGYITRIHTPGIALLDRLNRSVDDLLGFCLFNDDPLLEQYGVLHLLRRVLDGIPFERTIQGFALPAAPPASFRLYGIPLHDTTGAITGGLGLIEDSTEHERVLQRLTASEHRYQALVEAMPDQLFRLHQDGTCLDCKLSETFPYQPASALIGRKLSESGPQALSDVLLPALERVLRTRRVETIEYDLPSEGELKTFEARMVASNETEVLLIVRDITKRRRHARLLEGVAQAASRLLAGGDFDTAVSEALAAIGEAAGTDVVFVAQNYPHPEIGTPFVLFRHLWARAAVSDRVSGLAQHDGPWETDYPNNAYMALKRGLTISRRFEDFSPTEKKLLAPYHVRSVLIVPIFVYGAFWGIVAFNDIERAQERMSEEAMLLQTFAASLGAAIERQHVEDRLRHERAIADTLREAGTILSSTLDRDEVLGRLLEQARRIAPYDAANLMLIEDGVARIVFWRGYEALGLSDETMQRIRFVVNETPLMRRMEATGQAVISGDVHQEPGWIKMPEYEDLRSWLGVPIMVRGKLVGLFSLDSLTPNRYGPDHAQHLTLIARQAGIAYENAYLYGEVQRQAGELSARLTQLETLLAEIQELERVKSEMIRMASHDLRGPLQRAGGFLELLAAQTRAGLTPTQGEYLDLIAEALREMGDITDDILSVERIEARHQAPHPIDWHRLIEHAATSLQHEISRKGQHLHVGCAPDLPAIHGDPAQVGRALCNLLDNAVKYTPDGGSISVRIQPAPAEHAPGIVVEVEDTGIGIPVPQQARLFEPFYRADQDALGPVPGTGLGLSIVKAAAEQHGGRVFVDSAPGRGSTFGFYLPATRAGEPPTRPPDRGRSPAHRRA